MAWGRTMLSLAVAGAVFLRWTPHHGWFTATLVAACVVTATAINLTRKPRLHRAINGIRHESIPPCITSIAAVSASVVALAALGIWTVLLLPVQQ